jgi:hypothetical protein
MKMLLALVISVSLQAQQAKVIQLSEFHSQEIKAAYERLQRAQKDFDVLNGVIRVKYTKAKEGWEFGFEYDSEFKFIVPKLIAPIAYTGATGIISPIGPCANGMGAGTLSK